MKEPFLHQAAAAQVKALRIEGKFEESILFGEKYIAEHRADSPPPAPVMCSVGTSYIALEKFEDAKKWFQEALRLNPSDISAYKGLGHTAVAEKDMQEAQQWFKKILTSAPNDSVALEWCGLCALFDQKMIEAQKYFKRACAANPGKKTAYYGLGRCALAEGKLDVAEACFENALIHDPSYDAALIGLGIIGIRQQRKELIVKARDGLLHLPENAKRIAVLRDYAMVGVGQHIYQLLLQAAYAQKSLPEAELNALALPQDTPISKDDKILRSVISAKGQEIEDRQIQYLQSLIVSGKPRNHFVNCPAASHKGNTP